MGRLSLHNCTINQLHWSPISISTPILLSVNCDELAWWNIAFLQLHNKNQNRRSRMGFSRSPNVSLSPRSSFSSMFVCQNTEILEQEIINPNIDDYWTHKLTKNDDTTRPGLLGCVQLSPSCTGQIKVCVSDDFSKFLTVDIHGAIITYSLFGNLE